jgi:hypothetical protein
MRKIVVSALVLASLGLSSAAMAAATAVTGAVAAIDAKNETVTIDKTVYIFPAKFDLSKIKVGEKVTITFEAKAGKNDATKIEAAK